MNQVDADAFGAEHCYRYGGDEFLVIMPDTTEAEFEARLNPVLGKGELYRFLGHGRRMPEADEAVLLGPESECCHRCGCGLVGTGNVREHSVTDIKVRTRTTSYVSSERACPICGTTSWDPFPRGAENEANHVAMCQTQYPDVLSEFSWGDNGAYGNQRGDQGGWEASVHGYYDYPWDGILHFIGDGECEAPAGGPDPVPAATETSEDLPMPRYRVAVMIEDEKTWLDWMCGMRCECGHCDDTYASIVGVGIVDIEFEGGSLGPNGWYSKNMDGDRLIGITVYYDTPHPDVTGYYQAKYRAHWLSRPPEWGKWEYAI